MSDLDASMDGSQESAEDGSSNSRDAEGETQTPDSGMHEPGSVFQGSLKDHLNELSWQPIPWAPSSCKAQVATAVDSVAPLNWSALSGEAAACTSVRTDNLGAADVVARADRYEVHYPVDHRTTLGDERVVAFHDLQGKPRLVIRSDRACASMFLSSGGESCWGFDYVLDFEHELRVACGTNLLSASLQFSWDENLYGDLGASDELIAAFGYDRRNTVAIAKRSTGSAMPTLLMAPNNVNKLAVHDDTALISYDIGDGSTRNTVLARSDALAAFETLHDASPRTIADFMSDADQLAWIETSTAPSNTYQDGKLYVSPWPAAGAALVPRQVRAIDKISYGDHFVVGGGFLVRVLFPNMFLYRLSDGARFRVPMPTGMYPDLYGELALDGTHVTYSLPGPGDGVRTIVRCPLSAVAQGAGD